MSKQVKIYCDGACSGNPGPGGWGVVLVDVTSGTEKKYSGYVPNTTNNQMEITACIRGLEKLLYPCEVEIITDSKYVVNTMTLGWNRNKNVELWNALDALVAKHKVTFTWVKGHSSNEYNNECDKMAVAAYKNKCGTEETSEEEWNDETMLGVRFDLFKTFTWNNHTVKIYQKKLYNPFDKKDTLYYIALVDNVYLVPNTSMLGYTDLATVQNNAIYLCDTLNNTEAKK